MKKEIRENAKYLINRAQGDLLFKPEEDQESRFLQAFLLQASVIEGLLRESCNTSNKKNRIKGLKPPRGFHQAVRESLISGLFSKNEFEKMGEYIKFRNEIVHSILEKNSQNNLEKDVRKHYKIGSEMFAFLLKKF